MLILDACRYDTFSKYAGSDTEVQKRVSRGETTARFVRENFIGKQYFDTVYLSGNAQVGNTLSGSEFYKFVGLWSQDEFPNFERWNREVVPPDLVNERAIELSEAYQDKRLIVHYLQPHPPFIVDENREELHKKSKYRTFNPAREGEVTREEITAVYEENVKYVLKYVE